MPREVESHSEISRVAARECSPCSSRGWKLGNDRAPEKRKKSCDTASEAPLFHCCQCFMWPRREPPRILTEPDGFKCPSPGRVPVSHSYYSLTTLAIRSEASGIGGAGASLKREVTAPAFRLLRVGGYPITSLL